MKKEQSIDCNLIIYGVEKSPKEKDVDTDREITSSSMK